MTLPSEKRNALGMTHGFLRSLLSPEETPRIPKKIREFARDCLRHYPAPYEIAAMYRDPVSRIQEPWNE